MTTSDQHVTKTSPDYRRTLCALHFVLSDIQRTKLAEARFGEGDSTAAVL